ncbi:ABC transporter transmembrane domain-containing protein [Caldicellulosiruptor morganii]|uniref:ABC transporter transmembrane domain-containing protein n=1 Tax=Caldicellulosiruptor morganii TaxID=1387555 RepID=A0ABY7BPG6_9FIRM|nr:ABC transporter transmembrane domain-containing protein [Caldicellulosiruptor morganii]WAM34705.1 ABC transporter transmembrane domain-containing protein [Caldicellulosiruptor morganii]
MDNLKKLSSYFRKYKKLLFIGFCLIIISISLAMVNPYISKIVVDEAITKKKYNLLLPLLIGMLLVSLFRGLIRYWHSYIFEYVSQNILYDLRESLYKFLQNQTFEFFDKTRTGELMARMTGDLEGIRMLFSTAIPLSLNILKNKKSKIAKKRLFFKFVSASFYFISFIFCLLTYEFVFLA